MNSVIVVDMKRKLEEYTDSELFYQLKGDKRTAEKAFAELYARLSPRIYAYCRRFLGNRDDAMDVFQETFSKFFQSAAQERIMTNVPAFILRIARNLCVNIKRKERTDISYEDYMAYSNDTSSEQKELLALIRAAIKTLPEDYAEVFILREYDGLSYAEIAEVTGESLANVKVRIYRAKQKIRETLAPYLADLSKFA